MHLWRRVSLGFIFVLLSLVLPGVKAVTLHSCVPFHFPSATSNQSEIWITAQRNTSLLIYHYPLVLHSNIPYQFDDLPIHFYTETDDFTVCGLSEWRGKYCDTFGEFTLRTTKTHREGQNFTGMFNWWDEFEVERYGHQVLTNEFIWYNDGERRYTVPFEGTWCIAVYQDGHGQDLMSIDVGWTQTHGQLSVLEWMEKRALYLVCLLELALLGFIISKPSRRRSSDVMELCITVLLYHWCWICYLCSANEKSSANEISLYGWAILTSLLNVLVYRKIITIFCSKRPSTKVTLLIIMKAIVQFNMWSTDDNSLFLSYCNGGVLELIIAIYIFKYTTTDLWMAKTLILLSFILIIGTQYCIINTHSWIKTLSSGATEQLLKERMHVFALELLSSTPVWFVLDKFCWVTFLAILVVYC